MTSVTKTSAASALPASTCCTTSASSSWSDFGVSFSPAAVSTSFAYSPTGTLGSPITTETAGLTRSARVLMPFGLPGATMISSLFWQNFSGVLTSPFVTSCAIVVVFAVAMTSPGAPLMIWVTSDCEPANEYFAVNPGWSSSRPFSAVLNAEVSEDAARTVIDPLSGSAVADGPVAGGEAAAGGERPPTTV